VFDEQDELVFTLSLLYYCTYSFWTNWRFCRGFLPNMTESVSNIIKKVFVCSIFHHIYFHMENHLIALYYNLFMLEKESPTFY